MRYDGIMKQSEKSRKAPYIQNISLATPPHTGECFPFDIPAFKNGFDIQITERVTIFVGENGSGKSTLLEALAHECGFSLTGGNRNHILGDTEQRSALSGAIRIAWLPKIGSGFFFRAESFFNFSSFIDSLAKEDSSVLAYYGDKSLHAQSHGESFLALFNHHFGRPGIYLLDEPEAALSPARQLALLRIIHDMDATGKAQFIIATHSPILLSYPGAQLYSFSDKGIVKTAYRDTEHYLLTKAFLENPERYYRNLFAD